MWLLIDNETHAIIAQLWIRRVVSSRSVERLSQSLYGHFRSHTAEPRSPDLKEAATRWCNWNAIVVCTSETIEDNRFTLAPGGATNPKVSFSSRSSGRPLLQLVTTLCFIWARYSPRAAV